MSAASAVVAAALTNSAVETSPTAAPPEAGFALALESGLGAAALCAAMAALALTPAVVTGEEITQSATGRPGRSLLPVQ